VVVEVRDVFVPVECDELDEEVLELVEPVEPVELAELEDELELVAGAAAHDSLSDTIGSDTGRLMLDRGVPGATLTVNDRCAPPATVTITTHSWAEASGSEPSASTVLTAATAPTSFVLLSTAGCLLQPRSCTTHQRRRDGAPQPGSYWLPACFSMPNRWVVGVALLGAQVA
jgi:hypothetical protein